MRFREIITESYNYVGSCVNSFDDDGECVVPGLYRDVSDFANAEENYQDITMDQFLSATSATQLPVKSRNLVALYDADNDIYVLYDTRKDVHYFFTGN